MKKNPLRPAIRAIALGIGVVLVAGISRPHLISDLVKAQQVQQQVLFEASPKQPVEILAGTTPLPEPETKLPESSGKPFRVAASGEQRLPLDIKPREEKPVPDYEIPHLDPLSPLTQKSAADAFVSSSMETRLHHLESRIKELNQKLSERKTVTAPAVALRIIRPKHLPAQELKKLILPGLTPGVGRIGVSRSPEPHGILSIQDTPAVLDQIEALVADLDQPLAPPSP